MKPYHRILVTVVFICVSIYAFGQETAQDFLKKGVSLHDEGKYEEAIAMYDKAIKLDAKFANAYYEKAYSLYTIHRSDEALPLLEKTLELDPAGAGAYDMLGNIYDDKNEGKKAIEYYKKGIAAEPQYQRLHFNLSIAYYRQGQYADAKESAINALKLDPNHASSHRALADACLKNNEPGIALLASCKFLLLEPQSERSKYVLATVRSVVDKGIERKDAKNVNISLSPNNPGAMMMALASVNAVSGNKAATAVDSLTLKLKNMFEISHIITNDKEQPFIAETYSDFFNALAKSGNVPAFVRYITLSAYPDENKAWFKEHDTEFTALSTWVQKSQIVNK